MPMLSCFRTRSASSGSRPALGVLLLLCLAPLSDHSVTVAAAPARQQSESPHFKFKWAGSGRALKRGALFVSFAHFKAEDGVLVQRSVESYRSEQEARAAFEKLTKSASRIIQRGYKNDANGRRVGTRVELLFKGSREKPQQTVIAWTDGRGVFVLRSQSQRHVLDFEQQDYPASLPKSTPRKP